MDSVPKFKSVAYKKAYEKGLREGFAKGLAESLIETLSGALAESLGNTLQQVLEEEFLHCLERGLTQGIRIILSDIVRLRFGEGVADEFEGIIKPITVPKELERMARTVLWAEDDEGVLESARKTAERVVAATEAGPEPKNVN